LTSAITHTSSSDRIAVTSRAGGTFALRSFSSSSANGAAILVVSSQLPELLQLCDRIAVMRQGVLSAARSAKEWTQESLVAAALHASKGVLDIA
jgi:ABC-type polysaccharide/polyol phosphate transport system ATPase subunit